MRILLLILLSLNLFAVDARLKIETDVEHRSKISLEDGSSITDRNFFNILLSDLKISGHFLADSRHNRGDISSNFISPAFKNREYVLKYKIDKSNGSKLSIRLLRTSNAEELFRKNYAIPRVSKIPFLAHKAISDINSVLKYPSISWINRYVIFVKYTMPKRSEIVLADYTFSYQKSIISGGLSLFPKWADAKQTSFYYTSYKDEIPSLNKLNIYTGARSKIASSEGMIVCSDVKIDGSKLLVTMAPNAQSDIYEISSWGGSKKQITSFGDIDVNGKYANNEKDVVFVSNRMGYANIFKKSLNQSAVSQIVYRGRNNNSVDTYGDKVVYSSRESHSSFGQNTFNIYLTSLNSSMTRPLTTTGSNISPNFSNDGSIVQYIKHMGNRSSIGYINLNSKQSLLFPVNGKKIQSIDW